MHAELQHVVADLADNAVHHLHALQGHCHVAQGNVRLNLLGGEVGEHRTQTLLIAFKGLNRLVCASHQVLAVLNHVAGAVNVHRNHGHRGTHRNHRETGLNRGAFGGAVAGAGFVCLNGGVRHELHAGVQQAGGVAVADDSAIHLRQLAQAGCRELSVDIETARRQGGYGAVGSEYDECARTATHDAFQALAELGAGGDSGDSFKQ